MSISLLVNVNGEAPAVRGLRCVLLRGLCLSAVLVGEGFITHHKEEDKLHEGNNARNQRPAEQQVYEAKPNVTEIKPVHTDSAKKQGK